MAGCAPPACPPARRDHIAFRLENMAHVRSVGLSIVAPLAKAVQRPALGGCVGVPGTKTSAPRYLGADATLDPRGGCDPSPGLTFTPADRRSAAGAAACRWRQRWR